MFCTASDIISTACGQHVMPIWAGAPNANLWQLPGQKSHTSQRLETVLQALPASDCTWVPAYIAYGLLHSIGEQNLKCYSARAHLNIAESPSNADRPAKVDNEHHQELLCKLALHLAAQPDHKDDFSTDISSSEEASIDARNVPVPELTDNHLLSVDATASEASMKQSSADSQTSGTLKEKVSIQEKVLPQREQDFQQEMLQKLALHLAAHDALDTAGDVNGSFTPMSAAAKSDNASVEQGSAADIATPELFPATPSDLGDHHCQHYFIGDDEPVQAVEGSCTQCVALPLQLVHGLLRGSSSRSKPTPGSFAQHDPEFHEQMLQKLALHLAAQSEPLLPVAAQDTSAVEVAEAAEAETRHRRAWADITDDDGLSPIVHGGAKGTDKIPSSMLDVQFQQDMLQKLALHLAAQPSDDQCPQEFGSGMVMEAKTFGEDKLRCNQLIDEIKDASSCANPKIVDSVHWVMQRARPLSLTFGGSRVVQAVIDIASSKQQELILEELLKDFVEVYTSPHANHVLAKLIEVMPSRSLSCIGRAMDGKATTVARHQFGSRILERLVEHCGEDDIGFLLDDLLDDFEALARHTFGNFVVARMLEHSSAARKHQCIQQLLPYVLQHATHKTACNIVQRMLDNADVASQAVIADAFLAGTGQTSLEAIAATRYGSFVIQHLVDKLHPRIAAVQARVRAAHSQLQSSGFSKRKIVQFLGEAFFRE